MVHCPQGSGGRRRRDICLDFASGDAHAWAASVSARCPPVQPAERHLLVFVNPKSGSGTGPRDWAQVEELWSAVPGLRTTVVVTTRAGEASEYAATRDLSAFHGVVVVSGDGMVHEVWNGLASRPDAEAALRLPIGHIPSGSGNGLAKSILDAAGERYGVLDAAFAIARRGARAKTLMSVRTGDDPPRISFLSLSAATLSDIDIASEGLRCLGGARFTVWAVGRVVRPVVLEAELVYWPSDAAEPLPREEPAMGAELAGGAWTRIEDGFTIFWACQVAWCASDACPAPDAQLDGGEWHILICRRGSGGGGRGTLARTLLALEDGGHRGIPGVEVVRCRAFRLTPRSSSGIFSLDGEVVPFGPLQAWPARHSGYVLGASPLEKV